MSARAKILFTLLTLLAGTGIAALIVGAGPEVERQTRSVPPPLVRVHVARPEDRTLDVASQGTVEPVTASTLVAQVAGRIDRVAPELADGAFFRRGRTLLAIDPRDYELAVARAEAAVAQAEVRLARERAEAEVAREEWRELGAGEADPLVLREPQLAEARAALEAARADVARARLDLGRTTVAAPYDGRVRTKRVDLGQYVAPGTPLADLYATDVAEVRLPVATTDLAFLEVDLAGPRGAGPPVTLTAEVGGRLATRRAQVVRTGARLDDRTRMLPLIARIDDPFARRPGTGADPLAPGLFVEATIRGRPAEGVITVPRAALRDGDRVLVVDGEDRLRFRDVEVLRRLHDRVLISAGLDAGERICVSRLETVVDGMRVRTVPEGEGPQGADRGEAGGTDAGERAAAVEAER